MAAENRLNSSRRNWKRRYCRRARWIYDNVRKKIARGYQESHERCIQRRNVRNSRRALQYLQRLHNDARGVSSKLLISITKHKYSYYIEDHFEVFHMERIELIATICYIFNRNSKLNFSCICRFPVSFSINGKINNTVKLLK